MTRPIASLSLDLDNQWSYMKTHGDEGWQEYPSYLDVLVPRVLNFLAKRDLKITFFIVGQDAALERNRAALGAISAAGHEIGNHSFCHEPWLHLYGEEELDSEIEKAEKSIEHATGQRPIGFRGPGFSLSKTVLGVLERRGYLYDTSTWPTFIGPVARMYYFRTSELNKTDEEKRKLLFGSFSEGFRPLKAYRWRIGGEGLVELPVTTLPILRVPLHVSYLLYLSTLSTWLARSYFQMAMWLCRIRGVHPTLLLHPLDFLGCDDTAALAFFPGMKIRSDEKMRQLDTYLQIFRKRFDVRTVGEHVRHVNAAGALRSVRPCFPEGSR